ncbi:hypothetical protein HFO91_32895 [Rhizobium leguminosarum]|uniref:PAS-domain containing protein n=1 Tax=Rhizobium leguminosarum TaxID=384 RepID=UPI001C981CDE|nr:PAS-domain containing protein [Rhizobium leguminosarum]MBY5454357.1 hypothetical protein [Rhizobium leguminosarum]
MLNLLRALENMQQGVVLLDADLQVLVFNTQAAELLPAPKGAIEAGISVARMAAIPTVSIGLSGGFLPGVEVARRTSRVFPPVTMNAACSNTVKSTDRHG